MATQFTVGTLQNNFNPLKGAKTLLNKDYIRSLGVSLVTAGITAQVGGAYGIQKPDATFIKIATNPQLLAAHFQYNLLQQTVNTAVRTTLGKESFKGAVRGAGTSVGVNTIAAFVANKIGGDRLKQLESGKATIGDYILHKSYHAVLGAMKGAVAAALQGEHGDAIGRAALGGGIGGVTAEILAEAMREEVAQRVSDRIAEAEADVDPRRIELEELNRVRGYAEMAAVTLTTLVGGDIQAAQDTARNAVENNFVFALIPIVSGAMKIYDILTTAHGALEAYEEGGIDALIQYGVEEAVVNLLAGKGIKILGKMVDKAKAFLHSSGIKVEFSIPGSKNTRTPALETSGHGGSHSGQRGPSSSARDGATTFEFSAHGSKPTSQKSTASSSSSSSSTSSSAENVESYYTASGGVKPKVPATQTAPLTGEMHESRNAAFRSAKRDAGIPKNQQPTEVVHKDLRDPISHDPMMNLDGTPVKSREYIYTSRQGKKVTIQEHSLGHDFGSKGGNQGPHFNVRTGENSSMSKVDAHYYFKNKGD